ncbi:MAG: response regulator [Deltaproteobacteria bacterium]|nr:MAG: response regulator [Deltaproteobacteria bacterium]
MQGSSILVVDDEPLNRVVMRASLTGCQVIEAENGRRALEVLEKTPVDLVLLDIMMPEMDGYEVCRRIKETPREGYLPVLLVSALGDQADRNRGLEAGADDFVGKPFDRRELLLRVTAFLRLREQDRVIRKQLADLARMQAAKDDLVALIVHDLRSPLSGVVAYLQLLQEEVTGRAANDVKMALQSADTALSRLEETLQVRLLEEGRLAVRREPVTLPAIVSETLASIEAMARRKGVALARTVEGEPVARLDGKLVRRSMENLLSNALKYTPSGGDVRLSVRARPAEVEIEVADRGPGIPDELKGSLFEKFGSVEVKRGGVRKGFGLGLYLVKLVAQGHGGEVSVEDRPGGGSVFRMILGGP